MELALFSINKLFDPGTFIGIITLAIVISCLAWIASFVTTRLFSYSSSIFGNLRLKFDETLVGYIIRIKDLLIFITAFFFYASLIPGLITLLSTMIAGAGITALVVGFAVKSTIANLIAGLSLSIYRPVRIGDKVEIRGEYCSVEDITLRHTIVKTLRHERVIIPNAQLDEMTLINYSIIDPRMICNVELGVSYDTDIDLAIRLILEEVNKCPHRDQEAEEPLVRVISHGDFSIGLRVYLWVHNSEDSRFAKFWLFENIKKRFDREGVEIPFPYRTLVHKNDLPPPRMEEHEQRDHR